MDSKQRFDQLESLLVDLAHKVDQQSAAISKQVEAIAKQGEAIAKLDAGLTRVEQHIASIAQRVGNIDEQIGDVITIFKLSEARHTQTEQRLETLATEIREQGRRTDEVLQVQMQMLALMRVGNAKTDDLTQRLELVEGQEPRLKRLEDEVFRAAS